MFCSVLGIAIVYGERSDFTSNNPSYQYDIIMHILVICIHVSCIYTCRVDGINGNFHGQITNYHNRV